MQTRLELILGIDNRIPAPPHTRRIVVDDAAPPSGASGYAHGCLWIRASSGATHVNTGTADEASWAEIGASGSAAAAKTATDYIGKGDSLPASAAFVGQLFVRTGATSPGLYVSTGTSTPGWKTVTHAS